MARIVQKYGGSSVADLERMKAVARVVAKRQRAGDQLVIVVSAMGTSTDELLGQAKALSASPPRRELDMLLSAGERISAALLAVALHEQGVEAVSLTGSQCGIITSDRHVDARVIEVRPVRVEDELHKGRVVIVAGFQGMSYRRDITTLGRGGSDTTAVALAAALGAEACEIYSDVDGVLSADPRLVESARRIDSIGYPEMQELACAGARVLNAEAVEFAKRAGIALYARQTGQTGSGTLVRVDPPPPAGGVRGIAHRAEMLWLSSPARHETALLALLQQLQVRANFVARLGQGEAARLELWCARDNLHGEAELRSRLAEQLPEVALRDGLGAVSLIGEGIMDDSGQLQAALEGLREQQLEVLGLSTSSFRISLLVASGDVPAAVQHLHARFIDAQPLQVSPDF